MNGGKFMPIPKLIALDLDGTLLSRSGEITPYTREKIRAAADRGVSVVISTGRPYIGLPLAEAKELGIDYAITANGAAIYRISDRVCLYENGFPPKLAAELLRKLFTWRLHLDAFIDGKAYTQTSSPDILMHSALPDSVRHYVLTTRERVADLASFILENNYTLQKTTMHFEMKSDDCFVDRDEVNAFLTECPHVQVVCGGYHNLEFTKAGVTKAAGLQFLCDYLNIPVESVMACGDSENDIDILQAAGFAVAMENADADVKAVCDYVTSSCEEDGVGRAVDKFVLR